MIYNDNSHASRHWSNFSEGYRDRHSSTGPIEPVAYPLDWFSRTLICFMISGTAAVSAFAMGLI